MSGVFRRWRIHYPDGTHEDVGGSEPRVWEGVLTIEQGGYGNRLAAQLAPRRRSLLGTGARAVMRNLLAWLADVALGPKCDLCRRRGDRCPFYLREETRR